MKFYQLVVGQRFSYRGDVLCKTDPVTAVDVEGKRRLVPRSAITNPLDRPAPAPREYDQSAVRQAFERFRRHCGQVLDAGCRDEDVRHSIDTAAEELWVVVEQALNRR